MMSLPEGPRRWGIAEVLIGLFGSFTLSTIFLLTYNQITGYQPGDETTVGSVLLGLLGVWIAFGGAVFIASRYRGNRSLAVDFGLRFKYPQDIGWGVLAAGAAQLGTYVIYLLIYLVNSDKAKDFSEPAETLTSLATGWAIVPLFFSICLIAPFLEELFFRGLVMRTFSRIWGEWPGIVFSSVLFGLIHFQALQIPALAVVGMAFALVVRHTGRLGPAIIGHCLFNAVSFFTLSVM